MLDASSPSSNQHTQSSSPSDALPRPEVTPNPTSSPSPPRSIPPHMVLETATKGRSPTPELTGTAASSPSAAYASLTLEGENTRATAGPNDLKTDGTVEVLSNRALHSRTNLSKRPSSPAKRTAAVMENATTKHQDEDRSVEGRQQLTNANEPTSDPLGFSSPGTKPSNHATQHRREMSVDMLAYEAPSPLEPESRPGENVSLLSSGAYQTPQSGYSSAPSSTSPHEPSPASSTAYPANESPAIDDQINQVMQLAHKPMQDGQKGFIISKQWLSRVLSRGSNTGAGEKFAKEAREGTIGPVDNAGINLVSDPSAGSFIDEAGEPYVPLRPGLLMSEDFEILPQEAWDLTLKWYGLAKGSAIITRYCHNTSTSETQENLQFELHPPVFTILKLPDTSEGLTAKVMREKEAPPIKVLASRHERYSAFLKRAKNLAGIDLKTKVRVWRILGGLGGSAQGGIMTPAQSRSNSPAPNVVVPVDPGTRLVIDVNSFAELQLGSQRELIEFRDESGNGNYNGHMNLDFVGLRQDEVIVLEEQIGGPAGGEWVSDAAGRQAKSHGVAISVTKNGSTAVQDKLKPKASVGSGRTSPAPGGMMTRGRQQKNGRTRGTAGLSNLGNTCYMNSALQCIRSAEELTQYFLLDKYKKDLNPSNPLSHGGHVASAYALLLKEIYSPRATASFAPRNFKNTIGKYGPSFSGYQQQDSQEFLLFLLDGLQEDLSRIHKKPYIEKPDSTDEMVNDPVALRAMADKCWDIYQARNDSVITDLFAGMYKSTVVCPNCDKVSIIFDPFNNLTLQLPIENLWSRVIYFFPLHSRPIRVSVDIDKNARFMALKEYVATKVGVDAKKTVVAEIYKCRFYKMFDDNKSLGDEHIVDTDCIAIFELERPPSNYPAPKKRVEKTKIWTYDNHSDDEEDVPEGESPLADQMLVAVFNRHMKETNSRYLQRAIFGVPSYIVVTREEAKDYDAILRKVLAKVDTMTTTDIFQDDQETTDNLTPEDSDGVLMTNDDADSSSDSKVQAKSLESEDGMIDISMQDAGNEVQGTNRTAPLPGVKRNRLPRMLRPGEFILPQVRDLFQMKYFSSSNEMIPTGWATLQDENKDYPTVQSRQPVVDSRRRRDPSSKLVRRMQRLSSASSSDADDDDADAPLPVAQPSYESDSDGLPTVEEVTRAPNAFNKFGKDSRRNSKGLITYSRKGKSRAFDGDDLDPEPESNGPPLIRLGEAIVLDWGSDAYDRFFGGMENFEDPDGRGAPTWDNIPMMPDPELEEKRRIRSSRKRNGISLEDCLDEFGKAEILSENDAWYCPRCKEHRRASKTFELWKAPDILVVHLKRFSAQGRNLRDKLDVLVDFPVEGLDLTSRVVMQEDGKSPLYDLFAVDNHYGGLGGGHYTAFAQNFYDKNWYEYNDSSVSRRPNPDVVVTPAAYLLFYRRRAPHPLGGPFFEQIISAANNLTPQSQPTSRTASPAGEGKRLDDSPSRNGLSSALTGAGATHQAGGGGLAVATLAAQPRTGVDDELPSYSSSMNPSDQPRPTLESMEMDEDEAVGDMEESFPRNLFADQPVWSFEGLGSRPDDDMQGMTQTIAAPPGSDQDGDEDLFDEDSMKAVSPSSESDRLITDFTDEQGRQLPVFVEDEGTTSGAFGSYRSGSTPMQDVPPLMGEDDDVAVAEVRVAEGEMFKLD